MRKLEIALMRISISFDKRKVIGNFSATFPASAVSALTGPSGSGKSTILSAISGLVLVRDGAIEVRDTVTDEVLGPGSQDVCWVPQGANCLGARSALDNVMIAPLSEGRSLTEARRASMDALDMVGLLPQRNAAARSLSGGELQRVSFARGLASGRSILLADEPTSSLDEENTHIVAELLHAFAGMATVIVATHDPILIEAAAHVVDVRGSSNAR